MNLVLCFDGTWNDEHGEKGDRETITNVARLYQNIITSPVQQKWYDKGVGTGFLDKIRGGAFGYGLDENIKQGYKWLSHRYNDGDNIYLFGFSRGAYAKGYADAQRACGANGSASANPPPFIPPPMPAQNPQAPTGSIGGDTGAGSCVTVTRNAKGEAILKNVCSYRIFVWSCKQGMGRGLWPYEPGEKNNTYITGNISYAACKNTNPPYVSNTKNQFSTTCNKATGQFSATSYVCR
ncbi:MAG: phospholipase effector Tle1 domain-containing protein [Desulfuromonadaceae bacterium]